MTPKRHDINWHKREIYEDAAAIRDRVINYKVIRASRPADPLNYRHYLLMSVGGSELWSFFAFICISVLAARKRERERERERCLVCMP